MIRPRAGSGGGRPGRDGSRWRSRRCDAQETGGGRVCECVRVCACACVSMQLGGWHRLAHLLPDLEQRLDGGRGALVPRVVYHDVAKHFGGVEPLKPGAAPLPLVGAPPAVVVLEGEDDVGGVVEAPGVDVAVGALGHPRSAVLLKPPGQHGDFDALRGAVRDGPAVVGGAEGPPALAHVAEEALPLGRIPPNLRVVYIGVGAAQEVDGFGHHVQRGVHGLHRERRVPQLGAVVAAHLHAWPRGEGARGRGGVRGGGPCAAGRRGSPSSETQR